MQGSGTMHWHSVTTDMISWDSSGELPYRIRTMTGRMFFRSAIEADNKHVLVDTGVTKITLPDGRERNDRTSASHSGMAGIM